jgi:hypothetical protein
MHNDPGVGELLDDDPGVGELLDDDPGVGELLELGRPRITWVPLAKRLLY